MQTASLCCSNQQKQLVGARTHSRGGRRRSMRTTRSILVIRENRAESVGAAACETSSQASPRLCSLIAVAERCCFARLGATFGWESEGHHRSSIIAQNSYSILFIPSRRRGYTSSCGGRRFDTICLSPISIFVARGEEPIPADKPPPRPLHPPPPELHRVLVCVACRQLVKLDSGPHSHRLL